MVDLMKHSLCLCQGGEVEKELTDVCNTLLDRYTSELLEGQSKAKRVYDYKMRTELCEELTGLCGEGKPKNDEEDDSAEESEKADIEL